MNKIIPQTRPARQKSGGRLKYLIINTYHFETSGTFWSAGRLKYLQIKQLQRKTANCPALFRFYISKSKKPRNTEIHLSYLHTYILIYYFFFFILLIL